MITKIQTALNLFGYGLVVDGVFGPKTRAAVIDFQESHHLVPDGIVGPKTEHELFVPHPALPENPRVGGLSDLMNTSAASYPAIGWHNAYDSALRWAAQEYPVSVPCDDVVLFFKSVAVPESDFNRNSVYRESFGVDSLGLLQLSLEDNRGYKVPFKVRDDVLHPIKNLVGGVVILSTLQKKYPLQNIYQVAGKYWSSVRSERYWPGKPQDGFERFRKYFNLHSGPCKLP